MIAVIERSKQAVWGIGETSALAMQDAKRWVANKPHIPVGRLEYATLSADAVLGSDGETLWQWVVLPEQSPVQDSLF